MCMFIVKINGHNFKDNQFKFVENAVECIRDRVGESVEIKDGKAVTNDGMIFTIVKRNVI